VVGCHYLPPGSQLPSQPLRGLQPIFLLGERGTMGVNSLPKIVTRQLCGCDLNPGRFAPESSMLTTRLPSHTTSMYPKIQSTLYSRNTGQPMLAGTSSSELEDFVGAKIGFTFWYRLTWVVPDKGPLNRCVCVCIKVYSLWPDVRLTQPIWQRRFGRR